MKTIRDDRPTFYYNNNNRCEIRAGGIIFYKHTRDMNEPEFLMIKNWDRYEDFGGRTDVIDNTIEDTICREADEESNGIFPKNEVHDLIKNLNPIYCNKSNPCNFNL